MKTESTDLSRLAASRYPITKGKYFGNESTISNEQLGKWHEEYKAAEATTLNSNQEVIRVVQSDKLNLDAVQACINNLAKGIIVKNRFCSSCQHLFDNWPDLGDPKLPGFCPDWEHTVARDCNTLVMEAAARNGCRLCAFIVQAMRDTELLETFRKVEARLEHIGNMASASLSVQNWGIEGSQLLWINFPGKVSIHCNSGVATDMHFESAALDDTEDFAQEKIVLDVAKSWLDLCSQTHEGCKIADSALPTRLISVVNDPQLVLTSGWEKKPRYATLSHCWGSEWFLKLTQENYHSFLTNISIEALPKTFREAIEITRMLGVDYLWIDSLCIIQEDLDDWRHEAASMSSVYSGSFINITAFSAINAHQGCFLKPDHLVDGLRTYITLGTNRYIRDFRSSNVYDQSTTRSYLATRAWTLQEKLLPTRTIHIGNRGGFWECKTMIANEFLPLGFPHLLVSPLLSGQWSASWWRDVVNLYTAANLTYSKDQNTCKHKVKTKSYCL